MKEKICRLTLFLARCFIPPENPKREYHDGKTTEEKSYNRASVKNSVSTDEGIQRPKKRSFKESMQRKAE